MGWFEAAARRSRARAPPGFVAGAREAHQRGHRTLRISSRVSRWLFVEGWGVVVRFVLPIERSTPRERVREAM
jgi:hypothetical protein